MSKEKILRQLMKMTSITKAITKVNPTISAINNPKTNITHNQLPRTKTLPGTVEKSIQLLPGLKKSLSSPKILFANVTASIRNFSDIRNNDKRLFEQLHSMIEEKSGKEIFAFLAQEPLLEELPKINFGKNKEYSLDMMKSLLHSSDVFKVIIENSKSQSSDYEDQRNMLMETFNLIAHSDEYRKKQNPYFIEIIDLFNSIISQDNSNEIFTKSVDIFMDYPDFRNRTSPVIENILASKSVDLKTLQKVKEENMEKWKTPKCASLAVSVLDAIDAHKIRDDQNPPSTSPSQTNESSRKNLTDNPEKGNTK